MWRHISLRFTCPIGQAIAFCAVLIYALHESNVAIESLVRGLSQDPKSVERQNVMEVPKTTGSMHAQRLPMPSNIVHVKKSRERD